MDEAAGFGLADLVVLGVEVPAAEAEVLGEGTAVRVAVWVISPGIGGGVVRVADERPTPDPHPDSPRAATTSTTDPVRPLDTRLPRMAEKIGGRLPVARAEWGKMAQTGHTGGAPAERAPHEPLADAGNPEIWLWRTG
ncbi:hypothetical protein GCM10027080_19400 [Pedococcus soli]